MGVAIFIWAFLLAAPCGAVALLLTLLVAPRLPCPFAEETWWAFAYRTVTFLVFAAVAFVVILVAAIMLAMWLRL